MPARVFAIAAHPDDIEFGMAGTLLLLADKGCDIHCLNMANGACGSSTVNAASIAATRWEEASKAAEHLRATLHPPLTSDIEIFYGKDLLARVASLVRRVHPDILLVPSPQDYMEDHVNTSRLAVTAGFCRGMRNFPVSPPLRPVGGELVVYHAQPHGNRDALNRLVLPDAFVDIGPVIERKTAMLGEHRSQKEWLDVSQGMDAYLNAMKDYAREMGECCGSCEFAEGWRRHNPLGFCGADADPLANALAGALVRRASCKH